MFLEFKGMFPGGFCLGGLSESGMPLWNATLATRGSHGPYRLGGPGVLMDHTAWVNPKVLRPTAWVDPNVPRADRVGGPECSQGRPRVVVCGMCPERR